MVALGLVAMLVVFDFAYTRVPGFVDEKSLGFSVADKAGGLTDLGSDDLPYCDPRDGKESNWKCEVLDPGGSSTTTYAVTTDGACWEGTLTGTKVGDGIVWSERIDGCVRIGDNLRLSRRFLDLL